MRQLGIAVHNYHDTLSAIPPAVPFGFYDAGWPYGKQDYNRSCWVANLLPFMEQNNMADQVTEFLKAPTTHTLAAPFAKVPIKTMICPSDGNSPKKDSESQGQGVHGNYAACTGHTYCNPSTSVGGRDPNVMTGVFFGASNIKLASITDGTSNTLMFSELLVFPDSPGKHDIRGRIWNAVHVSTVFCTLAPPNSLTVPDNPQGYCNTQPKAPCTTSPGQPNSYNLARSGHPAGVTIGLADASVRFVSNNIDLVTWQALSTRAGGETIGDY